MRWDPPSSARGQPSAAGDVGRRDGEQPAGRLPRGPASTHGQGRARDAEPEAEEKEEAEKEEDEDRRDAEQGRLLRSRILH